MSVRFLSAAFAAVLLGLAATPAGAQQFSEGYRFLEAVRKGEGAKVLEILNEPGVRIIDTKDRGSGDTALHIVIKRGDATYTRFLLQRGANPAIVNAEGDPPMMVAVNAGFNEGVQILITYKANVNQRNSKGETPLIRAVQLRNLELVRMLLDAKADPDQTDIIAGMSARDYARQDARMPATIAKALAEAPKVKAKATAGPKL